MAIAVTRRRFVGASIPVLLAGCQAPDRSGTVTFGDGFEEGLSGWERGADVPEDPNTGGRVAWAIERSTRLARSGDASLRYALDGRQDDGTIWVQRPVEVRSGRAYEASVSAAAWSASESFNTLAHLVMYLGPDPPRDEGSFPAPGETSSGEVGTVGGLRDPLNQAEGWRTYSFSLTTPELSTDTLYLAVGISVVWETEVVYFVDDVEAMLVPA